ncbi:MAG: PRD domain-containing protein [Lactobacillales bacterium]|nr:PRD domain-containing protein [Lactobacillales bacterium]
MKVTKRLNNNVVMAVDSHKNYILIGKGLGFKAYPGDRVNEENISEMYMSSSDYYFNNLLYSVPVEDILLIEEIIQEAKETLGGKLSNNVMFTLLDHLHLKMNGSSVNNPLEIPFEWEIRTFYPKEFKVGVMAVNLINKKKNIFLSSEEAIYIALHFINAQIESGGIQDSLEIVSLSKQIDALIQYFFKVQLRRDNSTYQRFITHLKYYLFRALNRQMIHANNTDLYEIIKYKFPQENSCVERIVTLIDEKYQIETTIDEKLYLILHVNRLLQDNLENTS